MNIIIVGCGKVGFTLAETLSSEGHDISVVDNKEDALSRDPVRERLKSD